MRAAAVEREPTTGHQFSISITRLTFLPVVVTDLLATSLALLTASALTSAGPLGTLALLYWVTPLSAVFILTFIACGLYPGFAINPVEEIRKIITAVTLISFALTITMLLIRQPFPIGLVGMAAPLSALFTILARDAIRHWLRAKPWWGLPTIIIGDTAATRKVARILKNKKALGLRVVGVLRNDMEYDNSLDDAPTLGGFDLAPALAHNHGVRCAILALPGLPQYEMGNLVERYFQQYEHLLIIPDVGAMVSSIWIEEKDIGGVLGLELRRSGLHRPPNGFKRIVDLVLGGVIGVLLSPLLAAVYVAIRLSSGGGPALYGSTRIGRHGRPFVIWKFRSMVQDADLVLKKYLEKHPSLLSEWLSKHKLRNDPRITKLGRLLRRTSLDELPQLWNVLRGDMSLIGPRPIVAQEISRYSDKFLFYKTVRPGLTGLWQISGRSDTSYEDRVKYDEYYVRNWSIWLDIYILRRTAHAVLTSDGAY